MDIAQQNWQRYQYGKDRGHADYIAQAARCEGMYMGGGEQWLDVDKQILRNQGRPFYEFNEIKPSVNSAIGYQIANRMDIAYRPRGEKGDLDTATILSKLTKQIMDANLLHWQETQMFADGLIEQRGYFDVRISFERNIMGDVEVSVVDPRDVIPDPDAKSYDPDKWADVIVTRWLTLDEIEGRYGKKARTAAEASNDEGRDFGDEDDEGERNRFGTTGIYDAYSSDIDGIKRYRVIDRQQAVFESTNCLVFPQSGDVHVEDTLSQESLADALDKGAQRAKRMIRRIKWTVSTCSKVLHDAYSPYEHFTLVPYFAYFRRGKTRGMVDDAIGPQEALNKAVSQYVHIVNTAANSGWLVEENSLTNMDTGELEEIGARSGLVVEYRQGSTPPSKIQPNPVPSGVDRLIDRATQALKDVTVPEAMRGQQGPEQSGVAIQSKQFASQQQLAVPLDNLAYTRQLLARRILKLIQRYYDSYRVFRITEIDPVSGKDEERVLEINKFDPASGAYLFDVTVGDYDVVVSEQPMQITFENSQFQQALEMRREGVQIPDQVLLRYSSLADKHELIDSMQGNQAPPDPTLEAKAQLLRAQARKTDAEATAKSVETQYSAVQTAQILAMVPETAPLADDLLGSAGYVDQDGGPIVPQPPEGLPAAELPSNTHPTGPANPDAGLNTGIETPQADGVRQQP